MVLIHHAQLVTTYHFVWNRFIFDCNVTGSQRNRTIGVPANSKTSYVPLGVSSKYTPIHVTLHVPKGYEKYIKPSRGHQRKITIKTV